jgi:hypothetical protein
MSAPEDEPIEVARYTFKPTMPVWMWLTFFALFGGIAVLAAT